MLGLKLNHVSKRGPRWANAYSSALQLHPCVRSDQIGTCVWEWMVVSGSSEQLKLIFIDWTMWLYRLCWFGGIRCWTFQLMKYCRVNLRAISEQVPKLTFCIAILKIYNYCHTPEANELKKLKKITKISHAIIAMKRQALYPYNDWISGLIRSNPQCYITRSTWHILSVLSDWCTVIWYQCRHVLPHWSMSEHPLIYYDGMYLGICAIIHVLRLG